MEGQEEARSHRAIRVAAAAQGSGGQTGFSHMFLERECGEMGGAACSQGFCGCLPGMCSRQFGGACPHPLSFRIGLRRTLLPRVEMGVSEETGDWQGANWCGLSPRGAR